MWGLQLEFLHNAYHILPTLHTIFKFISGIIKGAKAVPQCFDMTNTIWQNQMPVIFLMEQTLTLTATANMVNVYLPIDNQQILALSIPLDDFERLSLCPIKWLQFLLFTICGVRRDLATTPNGPPVDDDTSTLSNMAEAYYFIPQGNIHRFHTCCSSLTVLFTF